MIDDKYKLYDTLVEGFNKGKKEDEVAEAGKAGVWRGGSSGCITAKGSIVGADPREVVLRYLGIQMPTDYDTQLMFDAGLQNEESFVSLLDKAGTEFKQEEEIPMVYNLPNGEKVTGRPDVIIGETVENTDTNGRNDFFIPKLGIELKLICSPFAAHDRAAWFKGNVDSKHLIQACHYAGHFNIPWVLAYTSRGYYTLPYYAIRDRAAEEKHMIMPDHRAVQRDESTGKPFMLRPFQSFYDITLADDKDTFLLDGEPTQITKSGIEAFYTYCSDCIKNKEIPSKRSGGTDHWGKATKKNKTLLYDNFKAADSFGTFDGWVESCRSLVEKA
jgi:hypothetical protein